MGQTAEKDPAVAAIHDLQDSVATSFEVLEREGKALAGRVDKLDTAQQAGFKQHAQRMDRIEHGAPRSEARRGWKNPGLLDADEARIWTWWKGRLLSGAGDESARERGLSIMEQTLPGELAKVREFLGHEQAAAFGSATDYVPVTISRLIDFVRSEPAYMADLGQLVEMGSDSHKLPKETTAPVAANYAEGETIAEDAHAVGSTTLNAIKGAKLRHFNIEAVMDASPDIIEHWIRRLVDSIDALETQQALEGAGTGNEFTGVKTASSVNQVDLANGGAALANLNLLAQMVTAIPATERDPKRCAWFLSSDALRALLQIQNADSDSPMLGQNPRELFGFPLIVTANTTIATTAGTPDTSTLYFGNWRGLAVGRRGPLMIDTVAQGAGSAFAAAQVSVRVMRRYAVITHIPSLLVRGINLYVAA